MDTSLSSGINLSKSAKDRLAAVVDNTLIITAIQRGVKT